MKQSGKLFVFFLISVITCSLIFVRHAPPAKTAFVTPSTGESEKTLSLEERKSLADKFGRIPLHFEANEGLTDSSVRFISRSGAGALFLKQTEAQLVLPNKRAPQRNQQRRDANDVLTMRLVNANQNSPVEGLDELPGRANYYKGDHPDNWKQDVPTYRRVKYTGVYEGVDVIYYGNQEQLEYDFLLAPGASAEAIRLEFENAREMRVDESGELVLKVGHHVVRQHAPLAYQEIDGQRREVQSRYVMKKNPGSSAAGSAAGPQVGIAVGDYDRSRPLVIDPVLVFSTYLGGSAGDDAFTFETGFGITVDASGNVYVAGTTPSADFPTQNPNQPASAGSFDAFITKLNPTGTALLYSSYFGGSDEDRIYSISLGPANEMYVSGFTFSTNFPTLNPFQANNRGQYDGFISVFTNSGQLTYSTYLGGVGGETCNFIKNTAPNIVTFTGGTNSPDFPTANALQPALAGQFDFFAGKLNISTNTLIFSTYYGGTGSDNMIFSSGAVDAAGNIYLSGLGGSFDYPTTPGAFQTENNGSDDVVVTKINSAGTSVLYSTYIGGNLVDSADALAVDSQGNAYVTGFTRSANFPTKNAVQPELKDPDAFVTKLNPTGTALVYSTFLGGLNLERGSAITVDAAGNCYVTGRSNSGDFPARRALRPPRGLDDIFVSKFNRDGALLFSTLLGGGSNDYGLGIAADNNNIAYVTGRATRNFFTTRGAFQSTLGGSADAFVAKINTSVRKVKSDFDGDGKTDLAVFRPATGAWYALQSSDNSVRAQAFGLNGDVPVPGDYDGDGKTDFAVFRPSEGVWYILNSSTNTLRAVFWGTSTDKTVPGDYDGDDKTDIAIYRPSAGTWFIILSSNNSLRTIFFGLATDKPVPADYDGDSVTDIAVYNPNNGVWSIVGSFAGVIAQSFGTGADKPVPADYDGDGYDDLAVYRPSQGAWYILRSGSGNALATVQWGLSTDIPVAGDYDGDGKEDVAVFRPSNGAWYVRRSSDNGFFAAPFGLNGDVPVPSAYVPQ